MKGRVLSYDIRDTLRAKGMLRTRNNHVARLGVSSIVEIGTCVRTTYVPRYSKIMTYVSYLFSIPALEEFTHDFLD